MSGKQQDDMESGNTQALHGLLLELQRHGDDDASPFLQRTLQALAQEAHRESKAHAAKAGPSAQRASGTSSGQGSSSARRTLGPSHISKRRAAQSQRRRRRSSRPRWVTLAGPAVLAASLLLLVGLVFFMNNRQTSDLGPVAIGQLLGGAQDGEIVREQQVISASAQSMIYANDQLRSRSGPLTLLLNDNSQLVLAAQSELHCDGASNQFQLRQGQVSAKVQSQATDHPLSIQSPSLRATVLGTAFSVDAMANSVSVDEGVVTVSYQQQQQSVSAGQWARLDADQRIVVEAQPQAASPSPAVEEPEAPTAIAQVIAPAVEAPVADDPPAAAAPEPPTPSFSDHPLGSSAAPYGYIISVPPDEDPRPKALLLFLHGVGEKGDGSSAAMRSKLFHNGPPKMIHDGDRRFAQAGVMVVAPQSHSGWWKTADLLKLLDHLSASYPVDSSRIYVTGLSSGGGACFKLAQDAPQRIAAIAPMAAVGAPAADATAGTVAVWAFHNREDPTVPVNESIRWLDTFAGNRDRGVAQALRKQDPGGNASASYVSGSGWQWSTDAAAPAKQTMHLSLSNAKGHNCWTRAYANPALWQWLFAQQRP